MDDQESSSEEEPLPSWIASAEAVRITGLTRQQVENLIHNGTLPARKNTAGQWRLDPVVVERYALGARERRAKRDSKRGHSRLDIAHVEPSGSGIEGGSGALTNELDRLRARVRILEDELAYEREAAENRWASQDAQDEADKLLEGALLASRKARECQTKEIRALEERMGHLRGPSHPGDLFHS